MSSIVPLPPGARRVLEDLGLRRPKRQGYAARPNTTPDTKADRRSANKRARQSRKRNR